jgi:hypothetical protein
MHVVVRFTVALLCRLLLIDCHFDLSGPSADILCSRSPLMIARRWERFQIL